MFEQRISASGSTASWSCSRAAEHLHGREMSAHGVTLMCLSVKQLKGWLQGQAMHVPRVRKAAHLGLMLPFINYRVYIKLNPP